MSKKNFHYYIQLTRGIVFLKVIFNHDFLRGLQIRFFGSSRQSTFMGFARAEMIIKGDGSSLTIAFKSIYAQGRMGQNPCG